MQFKDIVAIPGNPGLYRIIKPTRNGVIVEQLDKPGLKSVVTASQRVLALKEISIFTSGEQESVMLEVVLQAAFSHYQGKTQFDIEDPLTLREEFAKVLPEYDRERVKLSDMKKFFKWYNLLVEFAPQTLNPQLQSQTEAK